MRKLLYKLLCRTTLDLEELNKKHKQVLDSFNVPEKYRRTLYDIIKSEGKK